MTASPTTEPSQEAPSAGSSARMAALSSGNTLGRALSFRPLFLIIVANMIGTGIFTTSGLIMKDVGGPLPLLSCWLVGGLLALAGGLSYGELGAMFPQAGGEYVFLRESFGRRWAFLSGWISLWVGFSAPIAASASAFGSYCTAALPGAAGHPLLAKLAATSAILTFMGVHAFGVAFGARVQGVLSTSKIVLIVALVGLGLSVGNGSWEHFSGPGRPSSIVSSGFATSLIFVSFAYSGWNSSAYLGGDAKRPGRNIPLSMMTATGFVTVAYLALNVVFVYALAPASMAGVEEIGARAAVGLFGQAVGGAFSLFIAFLLLSSLSAMMMTGPRVYYAMARDGMFFPVFGRLHARRHTPSAAIGFQSAIAVVMVWTATFYSLLVYIGYVLSIFSSLTVLGVLVLRKKKPHKVRPYRTWGYPVTPLFFVAINLWIIFFSVRNNLTAFGCGAATLGSGFVACTMFERMARNREG